MRDHDGILSFAPHLPEALARLTFRLCFRGRRLLVEIRHDTASYTLLEGEPLEIVHHGEKATVERRRSLRRPLPAAPDREVPTQPAGRTPARRRPLR